MAFHHHQSISPEHKLLLHDSERQDEDSTFAENEKIPKDGGEREGVHIYQGLFTAHKPDRHLKDIKLKHQGYHFSTFASGGTGSFSPYYRSGRSPFDVPVRGSVHHN